MIFASDLDQTLIYSTRSMGLVNAEGSGVVMPAETKDGQVLSYFLTDMLPLLQAIAQEVHFIPVTTRTIEQYKRIELFRDHIAPTYAITSNGGNILVNGVQDEAWSLHIQKLIAASAAPAAEIKAIFDEVATSDWIHGARYCDELFYAYVIDRERMPTEQVSRAVERITALGWKVSVQGRKIYLVPNEVSKSAALLHLKQQLGATVVAASGDSLLDQCLLDAASHAIAPRHGELYRQEQREPGNRAYTFTTNSGIMASQQILDFVSTVMAELKTAAAFERKANV
ncbi:HAD family hydrolase [Paenibacillus sp. KS-LC4]|uniref:HAD family hydrolase n=1 Tax=Paenibacillus sp. KS-LC4 TaxID=2979727 RepID=UPI0030D2CB9A